MIDLADMRELLANCNSIASIAEKLNATEDDVEVALLAMIEMG